MVSIMSNIMTGIREYNKRVNNTILEILYGNLLQTYDIDKFNAVYKYTLLGDSSINSILKNHIITCIDIAVYSDTVLFNLKIAEFNVYAFVLTYKHDDLFIIKLRALVNKLSSLFVNNSNLVYTENDMPYYHVNYKTIYYKRTRNYE